MVTRPQLISAMLSIDNIDDNIYRYVSKVKKKTKVRRCSVKQGACKTVEVLWNSFLLKYRFCFVLH